MWSCLSWLCNMLLLLVFVCYMSTAKADSYDKAYQTAICSEVLGDLDHFEEAHIVEEEFLKLTDKYGPIGWTELRIVKEANRRTRLQWINFCYDTFVKDAYEANNNKEAK